MVRNHLCLLCSKALNRHRLGFTVIVVLILQDFIQPIHPKAISLGWQVGHCILELHCLSAVPNSAPLKDSATKYCVGPLAIPGWWLWNVWAGWSPAS